MKSVYSLLILGLGLIYSFDGLTQTSQKQTSSDSSYTAQAVAKYNQGLYSEAISLCDVVIKRNPSYSWAFNIRGLSWAGLGANEKSKNNGTNNEKSLQYYESSLKDYNSAITIDGTYRSAISNRAQSYYAMRRFDEAIQDWTKVINLDPKNVQAWRERGNSYYSKSEYTNAIADYDKAILYDPQNQWNYYNRGLANYFLYKYKEALPDLTMTLTMDPKSYEVRNYRGLTYYYLKEYDNALADFNEAQRQDPSKQWAYYNRGLTYSDQKLYDKAIVEFNKALDVDKRYTNAYNSRGLAYKNLYDNANAKADFLRTIQIDKTFKWAYYNLGNLNQNQSKHDSAVYWYTEALKIDPRYTDALNDRGWSNFNLKEYNKAIEDCSGAILLEPGLTNGYNNRGIIYTITGKYREATEDFKKAISLDAEYSWAYINILIPYVQLGEYKQAKTYYEAYEKKNFNGYLEHDRWKFLKTYLLASMNELDNGQYQKAQQLFTEATKQYNDYINVHTEVQEGTKVYIAFVFSKLGVTYEKLNTMTEAKSYYNKALLMNPNVPEAQQALVRIENNTRTYTVTDKTPPSFRLLPPRDTIVFEGSNKTTIIGKASDASGIAWIKIDGKNVDGVEEDGTFFVDVTANPAKKFIDFEIQDKAGNNFKKSFASVTTRGGRMSAPEDALQLNGAKFYGLFVTAEKYVDPTLATLNHPKKDAEELKNVLTRNYTFGTNDITILSDKSREDILEAISTTVEKMGPNDNLIIFFAGHGAYKTGTNPNDIEGYLLPVSAKKGRYSTYISASDLTTALKNCKAHHVLLLTDACYSGSLVRRSTTENNAIDLQYKYKSRQLMASGNLEPVPDESKFIYYLLTRLKDNTDKVVTADDLFQRLKNATINNTSGRTLPICSAILDVGDEGGQFVFVKK